ncbi:hypothetical protein [Halobellus salinisoli]|uniref:hypothetical protein n=1 Tax=Halobellus salinisoli TaxID=3108500 RepID=UPI00300A7E12
MSTETPSFDEMEVVDAPNQSGDDDAEWIELDAGESVVGELRKRQESQKYPNDVLEIARGLGDVVVMFSNNQIDRTLDSLADKHGSAEGLVLGFKKTEEIRTFTPDGADEEVEFNIWEVRQMSG